MNPLVSWGGARSIVVVFLLVMGMTFVSLVTVCSEQAEAGLSGGTSDDYKDGYINGTGTTNPPPASSVDNTGSLMYVGLSGDGAGNGVLSRAYMSFNTSLIPSTAIILSANLQLKFHDNEANSSGFYVQLYTIDYGVSLDLGDWTNSAYFQSNVGLFRSYATHDEWYDVPVQAGAINTTGITEFQLRTHEDGTTASSEYDFFFEHYASFYTGDSTGNEPTLTVSYAEFGTVVNITLTDTTLLTMTAYPVITDLNLTYDMWSFHLDTITDTDTVSIAIGSDWIFLGNYPYCTLVSNITHLSLGGLTVGVEYDVWFAVPKDDPQSQIHVSYYNTFTGEGFSWEMLRLRICEGATWDDSTASDLTTPDFTVSINGNYTIRIVDFFNNTLVDYSFTVIDDLMYVSIPVPLYSWQVFNMNEMPVLMKIYWNNSGAPWEFFVGPQWIIERNLKGGNYTFMVTFYDVDGVAGETVSYNRVVPNAGLNASFIMIEGTTLSEILSDMEGVQAVQAILTQLVTPSTVLIYEDLPLAPVVLQILALEDGLVIDPYLILEATTYQNDTGTEEVNLTLEQTYPTVLGATTYVLSDVLSFSGTYVTTIYINDTDGNNLYYSNVLPATVNLGGEEITIWANNNFSVSRASVWREVSEYTITYYQTQNKWTTTLNLNNSHTQDYYEPYWYIAFPKDAIIDPETVTLYDLDNDIALNQRTNFDVTSGGIHITLVQINASMERNFLFTMWDANSSVITGAPNLIAEAYTQSTLNGVSMKYTSVQWTNPFSVEYIGEIYITLNFTYGDCLVPSSIHILDETTGTEIPNSQYIYTGRTIMILTGGVGTVEVGGARSYGVYFTLDAGLTVEEDTDLFFGPIVLNGQMWYFSDYPISFFILMVAGLWSLTGWLWWTDKKRGSITMVLLSASITVVGFYLDRFM